MAVPKDGAELFEVACKACHGVGLAGAPKAGDAAAWGPRIAKGKAMMQRYAGVLATILRTASMHHHRESSAIEGPFGISPRFGMEPS